MRFVLVWIGVSSSCAQYSDIVRQRFAAEYRCRTFVVETLARRAYRVTGCGVTAVYSCASSGPGEDACTRVTPMPAAAFPAVQSPPYPWPPNDGRIYQHFDEFERFTIVQADMTIGGRVLRFFGAPKRGMDDVFLDVVFPVGPAPGATCTELLLLVGEEVVRLPASASLTGPNGEPLVRFQVPLVALDRGVGRGVVKYRFCGVDAQLTDTQVAAVRVFLERFRDVATRETPPEPDAGTGTSADAG